MLSFSGREISDMIIKKRRDKKSEAERVPCVCWGPRMYDVRRVVL